jgi:peroxiredoxin
MKGTQSDVRFLLVLLTLSLGLNTFLGHRMLTGGPGLPPGPAEPPLQVGDVAPPLELKTVDGQVQSVAYSRTRPTVLYVFSPACQFCAANFENVRHLARVKGETYDFVGLSLSDKDLGPYLKAHEYGFPVYSVLPATQKAYHLASVPQTLVVGPEGRVLQSWLGAYTAEAENEVERYFDVQLPGTTADAQAWTHAAS